ncbi:hypothetical protein MMC07_004251 [Pseudocyphellaria aurata]|nr:hypothetical protein [Pseudocyphellaria aurata]
MPQEPLKTGTKLKLDGILSLTKGYHDGQGPLTPDLRSTRPDLMPSNDPKGEAQKAGGTILTSKNIKVDARSSDLRRGRAKDGRGMKCVNGCREHS